MPSKPKPASTAPPLPRSDLLVVYRDPKTLIPYKRNARTHSPEQIEAIQASIREFGFTNPCLLKDDERTIGAGHARVSAAIAEGLERVPTITLPGLTETQWRGYILADNKLALNAGWNEELLKLEFGELQSLGFELALTGFSSSETDFVLLGWEAAPDPREKDGSHLDGITGRIGVDVPSAKVAEATTVIAEALKAADIDHQFAGS